MAIRQIESIEQARKCLSEFTPLYHEDGEYKQVDIRRIDEVHYKIDLAFLKEYNYLLNHSREITVEIGDERLVFEE